MLRVRYAIALPLVSLPLVLAAACGPSASGTSAQESPDAAGDRANAVDVDARSSEEDASSSCAAECEAGTACMNGQCIVPCTSNDDCGNGASCNAGSICLPPPGCVAPDGAADCASVCYGWCTFTDASAPDARD